VLRPGQGSMRPSQAYSSRNGGNDTIRNEKTQISYRWCWLAVVRGPDSVRLTPAPETVAGAGGTRRALRGDARHYAALQNRLNFPRWALTAGLNL
jgi:hypothetical protein